MTYPSSSDSQDYPRMTPAVQALIAINVAMLFLQWTVVGMLPSLLAYRGEPLQAWWTPITYMFVHAGLWHLAMNMYMLWIFGPRVEHVWGTKRFVWSTSGAGSAVSWRTRCSGRAAQRSSAHRLRSMG